MANMCSTAFKFYGGSGDECLQFHNKLEELSVAADGASIYFDDLMGSYGVPPEEMSGAAGYINDISDFNPVDKSFSIYTESRWEPNLEIFVELIEKFYPSVLMAYCAEEPGADIYCKYDPLNIFENYYVSTDSETDYFSTEEEVIEYLLGYEDIDPYSFRKYITDKGIDPIHGSFLSALQSYINDKYPDECIYIRQYDIEESPLRPF